MKPVQLPEQTGIVRLGRAPAYFACALVTMGAWAAVFTFLFPAPLALSSAWIMLLWVTALSSLLTVFSPVERPSLGKLCRILSCLLWLGVFFSASAWHAHFKPLSIFFQYLIPVQIPLLINLFRPYDPTLKEFFRDYAFLDWFMASPRFPFWLMNAVAIVNLCFFYRQTTFATHAYFVVFALVTSAAIWITPAQAKKPLLPPTTPRPPS